MIVIERSLQEKYGCRSRMLIQTSVDILIYFMTWYRYVFYETYENISHILHWSTQ